MKNLNLLATEVHNDNLKAGWWNNLQTGEYNPNRNVPEMLMLMVSEVSEADEAYVSGAKDDKLPEYPGWIVELADVNIRIFDLLGKYGTNIDDFMGDDDCFIKSKTMELVKLSERASPFSWLMMGLVNNLSRAMEGYRKNAKDDKMPAYSALEANLCRVLRDCYNIAHVVGVCDLEAIIEEKRSFNARREDHKIENRLKAGGKAF